MRSAIYCAHHGMTTTADCSHEIRTEQLKRCIIHSLRIYMSVPSLTLNLAPIQTLFQVWFSIMPSTMSCACSQSMVAKCPPLSLHLLAAPLQSTFWLLRGMKHLVLVPPVYIQFAGGYGHSLVSLSKIWS